MFTLKLIVRGPLDYDDHTYAFSVLDKLTRKAKDITLIDDKRIGKECSVSPSSFPLGALWFRRKWRNNHLDGNPTHRYSTTIRYHNPFKGGKQFTKGQKIRRLQMIKAATAMVAFHAVGEDDLETEAMIALAKEHNLPLRILRI